MENKKICNGLFVGIALKFQKGIKPVHYLDFNRSDML